MQDYSPAGGRGFLTLENMRKYSDNFLRDVRFYLQNRNVFNFDGASNYIKRTPELTQEKIQYDKEGVSFLEAFFHAENGDVVKTKHPATLKVLLRTKGAVNLQIKQWAQGKAEGTLLPAEISIRAWEEEDERIFKSLHPTMKYDKRTIDRIETLHWSIVNGEPIPEHSDRTLEERYNMPEWVANAVFNQAGKYERVV